MRNRTVPTVAILFSVNTGRAVRLYIATADFGGFQCAFDCADASAACFDLYSKSVGHCFYSVLLGYQGKAVALTYSNIGYLWDCLGFFRINWNNCSG